MITYDEANSALINLCGGKYMDLLFISDKLSPLKKNEVLSKINTVFFEDIAWNGWSNDSYYDDFKTVTQYISQQRRVFKEQYEMEAL